MTDPKQSLWKTKLDVGLADLDIGLPGGTGALLLEYLALLSKWNRAYNLTAVRDPRQMVSRHLLDSLAILPWVRGPRILDVGTGAGLPGIPLAIARPQWRFTLLDSNGKKTRFVQQVKIELGLDNVEVRQARVESLRDESGFDSITSRAFSSLVDFVRGSRTLLAPHGCWLAMKSVSIETEVSDLKAFDEALAIELLPLHIPGESATRLLVAITRLPAIEAGS
jgi:16S rRNA (guanine527-N7)-methyltransferase